MGPRLQRHLSVCQRGQMQADGWMVHLHSRLAGGALRAVVPGGLVWARLPEEVRLCPRRRLPSDHGEVPVPARLVGPALQSAMLRGPVGAPLQPHLFQALSQQRQVCAGNRSVRVRSRLLGGQLSEQVQSRHVRPAVQLVLPVLRWVLPLPPCERRVRLPCRVHGPRLPSSLSTWLLRQAVFPGVPALRQQRHHVPPHRRAVPVSAWLDGPRLLHTLQSRALWHLLFSDLLLCRQLPVPPGHGGLSTRPSRARQRYGSSPSRREGVVGGHQRRGGAGHPGGSAAGSAAALPAPAEGQAEQHAHRLLLCQPHRQLRIRRSRCSTQLPSLLLQPQLPHAEGQPAAAASPAQQP
ncbi:uncharacterized protein LOC133660467 isoform X2 [Entelurus aequoreus]|uniref:uncharacterized protein LOC133660467 isoform X2 n=1 Tax=Entelurus aequoreus TaxID=161455 RepID=UPI002B1D9043|nr:uncharacterized protein LOC133660467 isoform X2 [Entelurus aequoreus]